MSTNNMNAKHTPKCADGRCQINTGTYLCVICGNRYVAPTESCGKRKCGEYDMLKCVAPSGHDGEHCYVVDAVNNYPHRLLSARKSEVTK